MTSVIAPQLKLADVKGRAIMIHAGGDNYADQPSPWVGAVHGSPAGYKVEPAKAGFLFLPEVSRFGGSGSIIHVAGCSWRLARRPFHLAT